MPDPENKENVTKNSTKTDSTATSGNLSSDSISVEPVRKSGYQMSDGGYGYRMSSGNSGYQMSTDVDTTSSKNTAKSDTASAPVQEQAPSSGDNKEERYTWAGIGLLAGIGGVMSYQGLAAERLIGQPLGRLSFRSAGAMLESTTALFSRTSFGPKLAEGAEALVGTKLKPFYTKRGLYNHVDAMLLIGNNISKELTAHNSDLGLVAAVPMGIWNSKGVIFDEVKESVAMKYLVDKPIEWTSKKIGFTGNLNQGIKNTIQKPFDFVAEKWSPMQKVSNGVSKILAHESNIVAATTDTAVDATQAAGEAASATNARVSRVAVNEADDIVNVSSKSTKLLDNVKNFFKKPPVTPASAVTAEAAESSGLAAALKGAKNAKFLKVGGTVVAVGIGAYEVYEGHQEKDGHKIAKAVGGTTGAIAGGIAGAKIGAGIGAGIGVWFGVVGAGPAAAIGGVLGGVVGAVGGGYLGADIADDVAGNWIQSFYKKSPEVAAKIQQPVKTHKVSLSDEKHLAESFTSIQSTMNSNKSILDRFDAAHSKIEHATKSKNINDLGKSISNYEKAASQLNQVQALSQKDIQNLADYRTVLVAKWTDVYNKNAKHNGSPEDIKSIQEMKSKVDLIDEVLAGRSKLANDSMRFGNNKSTIQTEIKHNIQVADARLEILHERKAMAGYKAIANNFSKVLPDATNDNLPSFMVMVNTQVSELSQNNGLNLSAKQKSLNELKELMASPQFLNESSLTNLDKNAESILKLKEQHEAKLKSDHRYAAIHEKNPQVMDFDKALKIISDQREVISNRDITKTEEYVAIQTKIDGYQKQLDDSQVAKIERKSEFNVKPKNPDELLSNLTKNMEQTVASNIESAKVISAQNMINDMIAEAQSDNKLSKKEMKQILKTAERFADLGVEVNFSTDEKGKNLAAVSLKNDSKSLDANKPSRT